MAATDLNLNIRLREGRMGAYLARPPAGRGPGVLVIQEIFGVTPGLRAICDGWAARGYLALCPDLFWRQAPAVDLDSASAPDLARAMTLYQGFDRTKGIEDLQVALAFLRVMQGCTGKVGVVGYCLGGFLAYALACEGDADAAVGYYGVGIETALDRASTIAAPLLLHIAGRDSFVPPAAQQQLQAALAGHPQISLHLYPEDEHAFCRAGGAHYNAASCALADRRTSELFERVLA